MIDDDFVCVLKELVIRSKHDPIARMIIDEIINFYQASRRPLVL